MNDYRAVHVSLAVSDMTRWLCAVARPALAELEADVGSRRFFFVRYWEGGPHVRLRVSVTRRASGARWKRFCRDLHVGAERVEECPYVRETERYGGPEGMRIAEELFYRSSQVALLSFSPDWDAERARGVALACLLQVPRSFRLTQAAFRRFAAWSVFQALRASVPSPEDASSLTQRFLAAGEAMASGSASLAQFRGRAAASRRRLDPVLEAWSAALIGVSESLRGDLGAERLGSEIGRFGERPVTLLWSLLWSYLHMHANRLGLDRIAEGEVASLAAALTHGAAS